MLGKPCFSQYEVYPISGYFSKLGAHQTMLADKKRLDSFSKALQGTIIPGKSIVLDIGTGTGILAMMAAKLGAKRVFALETSSIINVARRVAKDNKLDKKIEFIRGYSTDLNFDTKIDIIVSETIGFTGLEENIVEIMLDARKRFGHKNTVIIPSEISVYCAPTSDKTVNKLIEFWDKPIGGFSYKRLNILSKNNIYGRLMISPKTFLSKPQKIFEYKLGVDSLSNKPGLANFKISSKGNLTGFALWFSATLSDSETLDSYNQNNHWNQTFLSIDSFLEDTKNGTLKLELGVKKTKGYISYTWKYKVFNKSNKLIHEGQESTDQILKYST